MPIEHIVGGMRKYQGRAQQFAHMMRLGWGWKKVVIMQSWEEPKYCSRTVIGVHLCTLGLNTFRGKKLTSVNFAFFCKTQEEKRTGYNEKRIDACLLSLSVYVSGCFI